MAHLTVVPENFAAGDEPEERGERDEATVDRSVGDSAE